MSGRHGELDHGFVLYPIDPKALARYREAFVTRVAKDDPLDSELLLDLIVRHRAQLRAWVPDTVAHVATFDDRIALRLRRRFPGVEIVKPQNDPGTRRSQSASERRDILTERASRRSRC